MTHVTTSPGFALFACHPPCSITTFPACLYCKNYTFTPLYLCVCLQNIFCVNVLKYFTLCVFRVQNIVQSVKTSRTVSFVRIIVPAVGRGISRLCGSTKTLHDTVCHATTARCREWIHTHHKHKHTLHTHNENDFTPSACVFQLHCGG